MSSEDNSTASTSSLCGNERNSFKCGTSLKGERKLIEKGGKNRRVLREQQRIERIRGKLTEASWDKICTFRSGGYDFFLENMLVCIRGSHSQFDAREGRTRNLMPPQTHDCCQTFSTIAAVVLSSLGFAVMMQECSDVSTVNYLLYISAWLHQISAPVWPQRRARPTIGDLNTCLRLCEFFPSQINEGDFEVLFYNQRDRAQELIDRMCDVLKRERGSNEVRPVCGYVIASGDYTVSIFSLTHDVRNQASSRYTDAWTLFICDSHGTQPWSGGKASLSGITLGVPRSRSNASNEVVTKEEGLRHFSTILFVLLEDHRRKSSNTHSTPYMTWSPIRRWRLTVKTVQELKAIIDESWLPAIMQNEVIAREARKYKFTPLKCFLGLSIKRPSNANSVNAPSQGVVL